MNKINQEYHDNLQLLSEANKIVDKIQQVKQKDVEGLTKYQIQFFQGEVKKFRDKVQVLLELKVEKKEEKEEKQGLLHKVI